jgi:ABC-type branched-subunit amino acid transport system ATPase component
MKAVEVVNVSKKFGALAALSNVNMYVDTGEIVGLIGPNGAGKTTLFNILTGFLKPDTGVVKIFGDDVTNLPPHKIAQKKVARSFQIIKPFPSITVLESVMVGGYLNTSDEKTARERAVEALKMVGVHHLSDRLAKELNTQQLKLVELARCLATQPRLLLLDELVAGLTPAEVDKMSDLIKKLNKENGITVLLVEHVMRFVMKISDRVVVLNYGEVISVGTPEEVSGDHRVIEAYLGTKTGR